MRIALIGAGFFAGFHAESWHRMEGCKLVGVCDLSLDAARKLAGNGQAYRDVSLMIDQLKPDLIDIATPPSTHHEMIKLAINHDVPAICQKPLAPSMTEAVQIARDVEMARSKIIVHENFRFQPWYREAKRLINDGVFGRIHSITFRLRPGDGQGHDAYLARQPYFQKMARFLVHETAIHFIDTFRFLLGEVTSLSSHLRRLNPVIAGEDAGVILMEFEQGATGLFDGNRLARHNAANSRLTMGEMWLEGDLATLRLDGDGRLFLQRDGQDEVPHGYDWQDRAFGGDCVHALQTHVISHFRNGTALENQIGDYMRNLVIEEAVYDAAKSGNRLSIAG